MKYVMTEDSGARKTIDADDLADALCQAKLWAAGGSYDERVMVSVDVRCLATGECGDAEVEAGPEPEEPECEDGQDHDWVAPYSVVGGCSENPGVWSHGGTAGSATTVCRHCGWYRQHTWTGSQRHPGELPETMTYLEPDEASAAWLAGHESR